MGSNHNRWMSLTAGALLGLVAAASPTGQLQASATVPDATASPRQAPAVSGGERALRLASGQRLVLSAAGDELRLLQTGTQAAARSWRLPQVRRNASLTAMPDGRVLIFGGQDARGNLQSDGVWFDPDLRTVESSLRLPMTPRSGHTATVLTDGRVLFAGGNPASGYELWNADTGRWTQVTGSAAAEGHQAVLQPDGQVRLSGRTGTALGARSTLLFDPEQDTISTVDAPSAASAPTPGLAGSHPEQGSDNVAVNSRLSMRFSDPVRLDDLNPANVTLFGPGGSTPVRVHAAEGGRLLFVTAQRELFPDAPYTLMFKGGRTQKGEPLPLMSVDFRTAALTSPVAAMNSDNSAGTAAATTWCQGRSRGLDLCQSRGAMQEGIWTPGQDNAGENWRVAGRQPALRHLGLMPDIFKAWGRSALTGTVLRSDGAPVAGVAVSVGPIVGQTDAQGQFLLYDVPQGRQRVYVDGTAANAPGQEYGQFVVGVDVQAKGLTQVPFTMWLPRIAQRDKIRISSPTTREQVLTHPDLPGMELRIPAGTVIRDQKGKIVTEVAIVPTPVNRSPYPLPTNFPMYFTLQPGGAVLQGLTPEAGKGARVIYPNYDRHPEGTRADFWLYDAMEGWRVYGQGRVNREETQFIPEPGVALHEVVTFGAAVSPNDPAPEEGMPPDDQECGECNAGTGENATAGDPIDLKTGRFSYAETDIAIRDVVPVTLGRNYRPSDLVKREFGIGTSAGFMYRLAVRNTYATLQLVLPNGTPLVFNQTSGSGAYGTWKYTGRHAFNGATLASESSGGWKYRLTMRDGSQMTFEQYSPNRIKTYQDRFGNAIEYQYDAGNVSRIVSTNGRFIDLNYDTQNRIISAVDPIGSTWRYEYNARGMLAKVIYPDNTFRRYEYRTYSTPEVPGTTPMVWNLLNAIFDQRGNRVLFNEYDGPPSDIPGGLGTSGRVVRQTLADGAVYQFQYDHFDGNNYGTLVTHPDGSQRRVRFDDGAYPISDTLAYGTPAAEVSTFERDGEGRMTARIDSAGRRTEYLHNGDGQVIQVTEFAGTAHARVSRATYNTQGQLLTTTDPLERTTTREYALGCLTRVAEASGRVATFTCNGSGLTDSATDTLSNTTLMYYMGADLVAYSDPMGNHVSFRYDALGREIALENGDGQIAFSSYDTRDRLVRTVEADGAVTELEYDANGNLTAALLPHQAGITFEYDVRDRRVKQTDSLGQDQSWTYDSMGRLASFTDRRQQTVSYTYDLLGRMIGQTYHDGSTVIAHYDTAGRLQEVVDSQSGTLSWEYDAIDQIVAENSPQGRVEYGYDLLGRRNMMRVNGQPTVSYQYDAADRIQAIVQGTEATEFDYDVLDRVVASRLPNGVRAGYTYNASGKLTGMAWKKPDGTALGAVGYGYDRVGKLVAQTGTLAPQPLPGAQAQATFDDNNRMLSHGGVTLNYDANGNLTQEGGRSYEWNARNQLAAIHESGAEIARFAYDAMGRRISRIEGGVTTTYLYDGLDAVEEVVGNTVVPVLPSGDIDVRISRGSGADRRFFVFDHLGSTRALTDAAGNAVEQYDYDPYGGTQQQGEGGTNPYQYTGRERDQSGLYYYRARYYHAGMGRFISEDPLGLAEGPNLYAYVDGDPLSHRDPLGHQKGAPARSTRQPNAWNDAQRRMGGRGFSKAQMQQYYRFYQQYQNAQRREQLEKAGWNRDMLDALSNLPDPYKNPWDDKVRCDMHGYCTLDVKVCTGCPQQLQCKQGPQFVPPYGEDPDCFCVVRRVPIP